MRSCTIALLLAACGDNFSAPAYDGHFHIELARNDAAGSAVVELLLHPVREVQVRAPGGTADLDAEGFLHFSTFDLPYRLIVVADGESFEVQHRAPHLELTNRQAGRRHPATVRQSAQISLEPTVPAPALHPDAVFATASTGLWTFNDIPAPDVLVDWRAAHVVDGEFGLLGADDRFFIIAYEPCTACAPYRSLTRALATSLVQVDGQRATVTGELTVPAQQLDVTATVHRGAELARVGSAFTFGAGSGRWGLDSIPSHGLGPIGRLPLAVSTDDGATGDVTETVAVHNPFAGTEVVGWLETSFVRMIEVSDETTAALPHGTLHFVPATAATSLAGTIGVPSHPTIDTLDDTRDLLVTWEQAIPGRIDDHVVSLFEIVDEPDAPLVLRHTIVTDDTRASIAANLLQADHLYVVRVEARLGYPEAAAGNYVTVELPYGVATTWSNPFTR